MIDLNINCQRDMAFHGLKICVEFHLHCWGLDSNRCYHENGKKSRCFFISILVFMMQLYPRLHIRCSYTSWRPSCVLYKIRFYQCWIYFSGIIFEFEQISNFIINYRKCIKESLVHAIKTCTHVQVMTILLFQFCLWFSTSFGKLSQKKFQLCLDGRLWSRSSLLTALFFCLAYAAWTCVHGCTLHLHSSACWRRGCSDKTTRDGIQVTHASNRRYS